MQTVCTRLLFAGEGPGDEASVDSSHLHQPSVHLTSLMLPCLPHLHFMYYTKSKLRRGGLEMRLLSSCDFNQQFLASANFLHSQSSEDIIKLELCWWHLHIIKSIQTVTWLHWVLWRVFLVPMLQPKNAYSDSFLWTAWNSKASPLTPIHSCELDVRDDRQLKAWNPVY